MSPNLVLKSFLIAFRGYEVQEVQALDPATKAPLFQENGEAVMTKAKVKTRENFTASVPVPTAAGIVEMLQGTNLAVRDLIVGSVHSLILAQIRSQTDAETNPANSTEELDLAKLDLSAIAAMRPEERGSSKFKMTDEYKTTFTELFVSLMSAAGTLTSDQATKVAEAFCKVYAGYRTHEKALAKFKLRLEQFAELLNAEQLEELEPMLSHLESQADKFLAAVAMDLDDILGG